MAERVEQDPLGALIVEHRARYPRARPEDLYKLLHQSVMGPAHAVKDATHAERWMARELQTLSRVCPETPLIEVLDPTRRLARVHLCPWLAAGHEPALLVRAFVESANANLGDAATLEQVLYAGADVLVGSPFDFSREEFVALLDRMKPQGFPAVHHSEVYRAEYHPAYRVVLLEMLPEL